jgi:hypothetical protein
MSAPQSLFAFRRRYRKWRRGRLLAKLTRMSQKLPEGYR